MELTIKWSVSRGRDTYGYNICSLWINREKVASCNGGGYDMVGTAFGSWLGNNYADRLKKLNTSEFYGLYFYKLKKSGGLRYLKRWSKGARILLDGGCGLSSMLEIAQKIGLVITRVGNSTNQQFFHAEDKKGR